jgi:hypothetical protein
MNLTKTFLGLTAVGTFCAAMMAGPAAAMITCSNTNSWGVLTNVSCTDSQTNSSVAGRYFGYTAPDGTRSAVASMDSATLHPYTFPNGGPTIDQYARVKSVGLTSGGSEIAGCDSGWDYSAGGASVADSTGCSAATRIKGSARISLVTTSD